MKVGVVNKPLVSGPRSVRHAKRRKEAQVNLLIWTESIKIQAIHTSMSTCSQIWLHNSVSRWSPEFRESSEIKYEVETVSKIHSCNYTEKIVLNYGRHLAQQNSIMVYSSVAVAFHKYTWIFYPSPSPLPPSTHDLWQASTLSHDLGLPRIYIAASSGACIGLAEELKHL